MSLWGALGLESISSLVSQVIFEIFVSASQKQIVWCEAGVQSDCQNLKNGLEKSLEVRKLVKEGGHSFVSPCMCLSKKSYISHVSC